MFVLASQLQKLPVISLQTGQTVASTGKLIINPDDLQLVAFSCQTKDRGSSAVLMVRDVRRASRDGILIDTAEEIEDSSEIVRLKALIDKKFEVSGLPVITESGQKLGKVDEYTLNLQSYSIQKLYLKQPLIKSLLYSNLVIDRSQIIDVTSTQITVKDATIKSPLLAPQPLQPPAP
jgi:sporulation protein YlmC with PRC-barrel domain